MVESEALSGVFRVLQNDMTDKEPQKMNVTVVFKVRHSPDRASHLHFVLKKYLQEKGIVLNDDGTIEV